jgi:acyl carrier protein
MTTNVEQHVKAVWSEMLQMDHIAPEQTFFEVGGDSLQMIDMLFRLGSELGMEIDPGLLFEDPSLRGFSALLTAARGVGAKVATGIV